MSILLFPVERGARGLRGDLLHHLVQDRYAAVFAGGPDTSSLSFGELHEAVGHAAAPNAVYTIDALAALENLGLVERTVAGWRATQAGVVSVDQTHELLAAA
ncbi:MAG: hypothetical protein Q7T55_22115 [Solirubrobacteraceae bacterium]|nr:hypothetical protein [Solirubrobacteraceae bacterium]